MKNCIYTPKNSKKSYTYNEFRDYLLRNHSWWSGVAKELAPSVLAYKNPAAEVAQKESEVAPTQRVTGKKLAENKAVISKFTQRLKAGFDAITKAMGISPKVTFLSVEEARKMLATRDDLNKLIAGFNMTKQDLQAAIKFGIANELEARGVSPLDIKRQTGWERGVDNMWKYEIGDARIRKSAFNKIIYNNEQMLSDLEVAEDYAEEFETEFILGELINANSELFKKYPAAKNVNVIVHALSGLDEGTDYGAYYPSDNRIEIYLKGMSIDDINIEDIESTLNHEIQHYIQYQEGFAVGGSPGSFEFDTPIGESEKDWAWKLYRHLAGEVEARNVQERMKLSPAQKLASLLESSESVPRINQIVTRARGLILEGRDFTIGPNGEIRDGASEQFAEMMKNFNWNELDSDYTNYDYLKTPDGKVLGFVAKEADGSYKIYIDPTVANPETPIHELAGHIFMPIIKEVAPDLYNRGVELVKGSVYETRLKELGYTFKTKEEKAAEALAQAIGDRGAKLVGKAKESFVDWLKGMWQKVGEVLRINVTPEKLANMKLEEFADLIAGSVIYGEQLANMAASPVAASKGNTSLTQEQADAVLETNLQEAYDGAVSTEMVRGREAYRTQAAGKIARNDNNILKALKDDVREYLTKGAVGIQKYTGAALAYIKSIGEQVKKAAIIAAIAATGIIGTMKASGLSDISNAAKSIKTELVNIGVMSANVANASFAAIKSEVGKAFEAANKPENKQDPNSPFAPAQALFFGLAIPLVTRKKVLDAIRGLDAANAKTTATTILQQDNIPAEEIDKVIAQIDERYEAKTEVEQLADHVNNLEAAAKLTKAQARDLMRHFRNFINSPQDLQDAMDFVQKLADKKASMEKLAEAKEAYKKLYGLRNSKKLSLFDKQILAKMPVPRFYLMDTAEMNQLIDISNDFIKSRTENAVARYKEQDIVNFFNLIGQRQSTRRQSTTTRTRAQTAAMLQLQAQTALNAFASRLPIAAKLASMNLGVLGRDPSGRDMYVQIVNALRAYDETGVVYDLGGIAATVQALNDAERIRKSPIISRLQRLAPGGISTRLQFNGLNADEFRRMVFGAWDRKAAIVTAESNNERLEISKKFADLKMNLQDRFVLGAFAFLRENSGNQSLQHKAEVLANQMNDLKQRIQDAKKYGSSAEDLRTYQHYYTGATNALSSIGALVEIGGLWQAPANLDINAIEQQVAPNVMEAWMYSQSLLTGKFPAYEQAMQMYHGRSFDQIQDYFPRHFIRTTPKVTDITNVAAQLPALGNLGGGTTRQATNIAARNKGREMMPNRGGFYVLDGYELLANGLWDINATINLSDAYAHTNALVNKEVIVDSSITDEALKEFLVSSISGILKDPLLFVDSRNNWEKATSLILNAATQTVLNNFTQHAKQRQAMVQGYVTNPNASMSAATLQMKAISDPALQSALNKFFNNTSEPFTSQLSYIEIENNYYAQPNQTMQNINKVFEFLNPKSLIAANRSTQRQLLLSEYIAERKKQLGSNFVDAQTTLMNDAANGFDETALAAAENNAEAANSAANRHFLPMELKKAGAYKKFIYFLGTYTFVAVNEFFTNARVLASPGYTGYQKRVAATQMGGFIAQQIMFQIVTRAISESLKAVGRKLDWLDEEDEEKKKERREKYFYQIPSQVLFDIATGWLPSFWSGSIKTVTNGLAESLQDGFSSTEDEAKQTLDVLFQKKEALPGPLGIVGDMYESLAKSVTSGDEQLMALTIGQAATMALGLGDAYYILKLKSQSVKSILNAEGNEDALKALRRTDVSAYKEYINNVRKAGVPDEIMHYMSWKDEEQGYYIKSEDAAKFYELYKKNYEEQYKEIREDNPENSETSVKRKARNAAGLLTQEEFTAVPIDLKVLDK